jgi:hypothetical protein
MEVLKKVYWLFLDLILYGIMGLIFFLTVLGVCLKTMIDKFCYKFFGKLDDICEWIAEKLAGKRCECKKGVKND